MRSVVVVAVLVLQATTTAAAPTAAEVVKRVQAHYAKVQQLTATFHEYVTQAAFGTEGVSEGTVQLAKPSKMHWDYTSKNQVKRSFISDGTTLYAVDYINREATVLKIAASSLPVVVSFLYGQGNLAATFDAAIDSKSPYASATTTVIALTPKQPTTQYASLTLVVDAQDRVVQSIITDSNHNTTRFELANQDTITTIPSARFVLDPKHLGPTWRVVTP